MNLLNKVKNLLFGETPAEVFVKAPPKRFEIGGILGDCIEWFDKDEFHQNKSVFTVVGWKEDLPQVGDELVGEFERSGKVLFKFIEVDWKIDPPDMFFGKVSCIKILGKN